MSTPSSTLLILWKHYFEIKYTCTVHSVIKDSPTPPWQPNPNRAKQTYLSHPYIPTAVNAPMLSNPTPTLHPPCPTQTPLSQPHCIYMRPTCPTKTLQLHLRPTLPRTKTAFLLTYHRYMLPLEGAWKR